MLTENDLSAVSLTLNTLIAQEYYIFSVPQTVSLLGVYQTILSSLEGFSGRDYVLLEWDVCCFTLQTDFSVIESWLNLTPAQVAI